MRLTKIYTKTGDRGRTKLANGADVGKDDARVEAYGCVDELNACLGLWRDSLSATSDASQLSTPFGKLSDSIIKIQNEIFDLGGELCTPASDLDVAMQQVVNNACIERLEAEIDAFNESLPSLMNFTLPGGHTSISMAHLCRTVCRRAERRLVSLATLETIRPEPIIYLNRLSDWLFVAGRTIGKELNRTEILWQQRNKGSK